MFSVYSSVVYTLFVVVVPPKDSVCSRHPPLFLTFSALSFATRANVGTVVAASIEYCGHEVCLKLVSFCYSIPALDEVLLGRSDSRADRLRLQLRELRQHLGEEAALCVGGVDGAAEGEQAAERWAAGASFCRAGLSGAVRGQAGW